MKISFFVFAAGFNLHERGGQSSKKEKSALVIHFFLKGTGVIIQEEEWFPFIDILQLPSLSTLHKSWWKRKTTYKIRNMPLWSLIPCRWDCRHNYTVTCPIQNGTVWTFVWPRKYLWGFLAKIWLIIETCGVNQH